MYSVTSRRTCWLFVSDSNESRHLFDIVYAADGLKRRGVSANDILVFTDHHAPTPHLAPYGLSQVSSLSSFEARVGTLQDYEIATIVVTGHGRPDGIGESQLVISPYALLRSTRTIPGLQIGIGILGQCFAGIFNLMDAREKPEVVLIGATNLNTSLSAAVNLASPILQADGSPGLSSWLANIFLLEFFSWLSAPTDVDGDGALTLLDGYKFAGARSNAGLISIKSGLYVEATKLVDLIKALQTANPVNMLAVEAARKKLQITLETLHLHQEPWLLHANRAREVLF